MEQRWIPQNVVAVCDLLPGNVHALVSNRLMPYIRLYDPSITLEATETSRQAHQKIINRKSAMTKSVCSIQTSRKRLTGLRQNLSADMD